MIKKLNHIGVSVLDIKKTMDRLNSVFKVDSVAIHEREDLKSSFPLVGDVLFEVIEPKIGEGIKALKKRGEGISHLCFEVDNIEEDVKSWVAGGLRLRGSGIRNRLGRKVAFFEPADTFGVMIQLVQFEKDRTGSPY